MNYFTLRFCLFIVCSAKATAVRPLTTTSNLKKLTNCLNNLQNQECDENSVAVPLPFFCPGSNTSTWCAEVERKRFSEIQIDGNLTIRNILEQNEKCPISNTSGSSFVLKLDSIEAIYGIIIKTFSGEDLSNVTVQIGFNRSSQEMDRLDCLYHVKSVGSDSFFCLTEENVQNYDKDFQEIGLFGHWALVSSRRPIRLCSIEWISHPIKPCGSPGFHEGLQEYRPKKEIYYSNETVLYSCTNSSNRLIGNSNRNCQRNGTWTGKIPFCSPEKSFIPIAVYNVLTKTFIKDIPVSLQHNETLRYELNQTIEIKQIVVIAKNNDKNNIIVVSIDGKPLQHNRSECTNKNGIWILKWCSQQKFINTYSVKSQVTAKTIEIRNTCLRCQEEIYNVSVFGYETEYNHGKNWKRDRIPFTDINEGSQSCRFGFQTIKTGKVNDVLELDHNDLQCQRIFCSPPQAVDKAHWEYLHDIFLEENYTVEYKCLDGFQLQGDGNLTCQNGTWNLNTPKCRAIYQTRLLEIIIPIVFVVLVILILIGLIIWIRSYGHRTNLRLDEPISMNELKAEMKDVIYENIGNFKSVNGSKDMEKSNEKKEIIYCQVDFMEQKNSAPNEPKRDEVTYATILHAK